MERNQVVRRKSPVASRVFGQGPLRVPWVTGFAVWFSAALAASLLAAGPPFLRNVQADEGARAVGECEIEAQGTLEGGQTFGLEAELEEGDLEGRLHYRDRAAAINFRSTKITSLVADGRFVSIQGRGKARSAHSLRFNVTLDMVDKTFEIRLSSGYALAGNFAGDDDLEISGFCAFDGVAILSLDEARAATTVMGRAGGELTARGVTLEVPAGALSEDVEITMTPISELGDSPLQNTLIGGVVLEPDGLRFLKPVLLTMALPAGVSPLDVVGFGSATDGTDLHLHPRRVEDNTIELELWHFSTAGASAGGASAVAAVQTYQPSTAERQALQRLAAAEPGCSAEQLQGIFDGPACQHLNAEGKDAFSEWYENTVRPGLVQAVGAPASQVVEAMTEWFHWQVRVAELLEDLTGPCGSLQAKCNEAHKLATDAIANLAQRRLQNCTGTSLVSEIRDVTQIADFVVAGAIDLTTATPMLPVVDRLIDACVGTRIDSPTFPAVAARTRANHIAVRAYVETYTGAQLANVPLQLFLDVHPGAADATSGLLDNQGRFETNVYPTGANSTDIDITVELASGALPEIPPGSVRDGFTKGQRLTSRVRERVEIEALGPTTGLGPGDAVRLRVKVAGDGMSHANITYSLSGPGQLSATSATTNADGEAPLFDYTAPSPGGGSATVTATFGGDSASLTIDVVPAISVSINPAAAILSAGGTAQFSASVTGATNSAVDWTATGGTISQAGFYTAGTTPGAYTVIATSVEDPAVSASATVSITAVSNLLAGHISETYSLSGDTTASQSVEVDVVARVEASGAIVVESASGTMSSSTTFADRVLEDASGQTFTCPGDQQSFSATISDARYIQPAGPASGNIVLIGSFTWVTTSSGADLDEFGMFVRCTSSTSTNSGSGDVHSIRGVHEFSGGEIVAIDFNHVADFGNSETLVRTGRLERQ